MIATESTMSK